MLKSGLGLAPIYNFSIHPSSYGQIGVVSKLDEGATFYFILPVHE